MYESEKTGHCNIKEINKIRSAKDYLARKKLKCASQNRKGVKKRSCKSDFLPGGRFYCK
jgi:hypothetical protein